MRNEVDVRTQTEQSRNKMITGPVCELVQVLE